VIQPQSRLRVADNTGARSIQCIRVMGRSLKTSAGVGDVIIASVKQAIPNAAVKKGDVVRAVVVPTAATSASTRTPPSSSTTRATRVAPGSSVRSPASCGIGTT